jgi:hypothetical protein
MAHASLSSSAGAGATGGFSSRLILMPMAAISASWTIRAEFTLYLARRKYSALDGTSFVYGGFTS